MKGDSRSYIKFAICRAVVLLICMYFSDIKIKYKKNPCTITTEQSFLCDLYSQQLKIKLLGVHKHKYCPLALKKWSFFFPQGDEQVIDDAFKEKDPQRHCAMRGMSGKVKNAAP